MVQRLHHLNTGEDGGYLKCYERVCYVGPIAGKLSTFQPTVTETPTGLLGSLPHWLAGLDDLISPVGISAHRNEEGRSAPIKVSLRPTATSHGRLAHHSTSAAALSSTDRSTHHVHRSFSRTVGHPGMCGAGHHGPDGYVRIVGLHPGQPAWGCRMTISTSPLEIIVVLLAVAACAVSGGDLAIRGGTLRGLGLSVALGAAAVALVAMFGGR